MCPHSARTLTTRVFVSASTVALVSAAATAALAAVSAAALAVASAVASAVALAVALAVVADVVVRGAMGAPCVDSCGQVHDVASLRPLKTVSSLKDDRDWTWLRSWPFVEFRWVG